MIGMGDELRLAQTDAILSGTRTHCQPALPKWVELHRSDNRRRLFEFHALTFQVYRTFHFEDSSVSFSANVGGGGKDSFCCVFEG